VELFFFVDEKRSEFTDGRNQRKRKVRAEVSSHHVGVIFFSGNKGSNHSEND